MKRLLNIAGSVAGLGVMVVLVVMLISSLRAIQPNETQIESAQSPLSTPTADVEPTPVPIIAATEPVKGVFESPVQPTSTPDIPDTPTPEIVRPPLCKFEGKAQEVAPDDASKLELFQFSEPKVVLSREGAIEIIEWLPDNQNLLIHIQDDKKQSIETLNIETGKTEIYADNLQNANRIHWVPDRNGVVYNEHKTMEFSGIDQDGIWLSKGGKQTELLLEDARLFEADTKAANLPDDIASILNVYDFSFDPNRWLPEGYTEEVRFAWSVSPDKSRALFFGVPWLYLVDLKTNQPCQVEWEMVGYRAYTARWDSGNRYAAMLVSNNAPGELMYFNRLVILDTVTGQVYTPEMAEWSHIWDFQWFPDNRHLLVMGQRENIDNAYQNQQLGIVDVFSQGFRVVLPDYVFGGGQPGFQLAMSSSGQSLNIKCPIWSKEEPLILENQICLISIKTKS